MEATMTGWAELAACKDEDPELFFPISEVGPGARQTAQAKAVCARCPVRAECLGYALDNGLDHGVFGGTTADERRRLVRTAPQRHRAA
ncbi:MULTISPECIES: WhiB family transcriptional regulator [Amycolatopsis]|jgi:WhiB family transcriptional regulator, redox-sensing transcriptional regulator|uniref:Transcriptional regulator WhiB n=3 Tax=Amycolatopsis TaxID=1813 RepID=R1GFX3_9PSEU|nr:MULTISPECIES: WhiB family transcriptional regulator [Amycolatopsis]EOD70187.1 WhiB family transcriptional regulator [Amycolatopsis vancoresmycina DSM 44592]OXM68688.1 WhiB family transcriptional regulator [Amycolatopsis vastitatis]